jgi:hypothetical protein
MEQEIDRDQIKSNEPDPVSRCRALLEDSGYAVVPRVPTREMLDAAWADALAEDAAGVWAAMIEAAERLCP